MCRVEPLASVKARHKERRAKKAARQKEEHYALIATQFDEDHAFCLVCGAWCCEECSLPSTTDTSTPPPQVSPHAVTAHVVETRLVKTRIAVDNLCCELESKLVSKALGSLAQDVIVNVIRREIIVTHSCPPNELVDALNKAHLGARLVEASNEHQSDTKRQSWRRRLAASLPTLLACIAVGLMGLGVFRFPVVLAALGVAGGLISLIRALRTLWAQIRIDINALMCLAIVAALVSKDYTEAAAVTTAFAFAQALQAECLRHVRDILRVETMPALQPTFFSLKHQRRIERPEIGEIISVRAGDATCHATVRSGTAVCDRSSVTGESVPVIRKPGDTVEEGTLVLDGYLELAVLQPPSHSESIVTAAMDAAASRGKSKQLATRVANIIAPVVVVAAALALIPYTGGKPHFKIALALLVLACPCSLVLAGPLPTSAAIAAASKKFGILITSGDALEALNYVDEIATDKTGTLTLGKCVVVEERVLAKHDQVAEAKRLAASLEAQSAHPLASAIVAHVIGTGPAHAKIELSDDVIVDLVERGRGVCGLVDTIPVAVGNSQLVPVPADLFSEPGTVVGVAINHTPVLAFLIVDPVRPSAPSIVQRFYAKKKAITMLTGDNTDAANSVAKTLRIKNVRAQLSPEEKLKYIQDQTRPIAMIGDGANDAQALRAAAVGIAVVRSGVATAAADIVTDFDHLPALFDLAEQATVILKENIALTLLLKVCAAAVVIGGYATVSAAVLADVFSLLIVVANGLRPMSLIWHHDPEPLTAAPDETTIDAPDTAENDEDALCELV